MLKKEDWMDIKAEHERGVYQKDIANRLGVHPKTVSRALARQGAPVGIRPNAHKSKLDEFKPYIDELLREGVWNAKVILMECRQRGYTGSYSVVRDYIHPKRPLREGKATVRYETEPGHQMQNDWGTVTVQVGGSPQKVHFTVNTLGYSRRFHFWCAEKEDAEHTYEGIIRAFEHFGGVPKEVLVDNQKSLVVHHHIRDAVHFNERFLDLAGHYGFTPRACAPYRARTKGKDESGVKYVKRNALAGHRFGSWGELEAHLDQWVREVADVRVHGTTGEAPRARFDRDERRALQPLRGRPPFEQARSLVRVVNSEACVEVDTNAYSVPWRLIGESVTVVLEAFEIRISHGGREVARHRVLEGSRCRSVDPGHFDGLARRVGFSYTASFPESGGPLSGDLARPLREYEAMLGGGF